MIAQPMILLAASGLAREVIAAVSATGSQTVVGILDDNELLHGTEIGGVGVLGSISSASEHPEAQFVVCAGAGHTRARIVERLRSDGIGPDRFASVVDHTVRIPEGCVVGCGCILLAQVVLTADIHLGEHVIAMPHVVMTHDNVVGDYATLCAGVTLGGNVRIGRAAYLGMNSAVRQGVQVGEDSVLGMGAVLLADLPPHRTWVGVPAADLVAVVGARGERP